MPLPRPFLLANSVVCFVLGYVLNGLLLWLIAKRTTDEMVSYRPVLLLSTMVDFVYLAVNLVVVPVVVVGGGSTSLVSLGPLAWVPQPYSFALIATWLLFYGFARYSPAAPFFYRHAIICWGKQYRISQFIAILIAPTLMSIGFIGVHFTAGYIWNAEQQEQASQYVFNKSCEPVILSTTLACNTVATFAPSTSPRTTRLVSIYSMASILTTYTIIITCGWRIYRRLSGEATSNLTAQRARELNLQLVSTLLLQAIPPFVLQFAPTMQLTLSLLTGWQLGSYSGYLTAAFAWIAVVNPLIAMWVLRAYRKEVGRWLRPWKWGEPRSSTTYGGGATAVGMRAGVSPRVGPIAVVAATASTFLRSGGQQSEGEQRKTKTRRSTNVMHPTTTAEAY